MIQYQNMVDIFYAVKTLRNCKPNMVESLVRESVNRKSNVFKWHKYSCNDHDVCLFVSFSSGPISILLWPCPGVLGLLWREIATKCLPQQQCPMRWRFDLRPPGDPLNFIVWTCELGAERTGNSKEKNLANLQPLMYSCDYLSVGDVCLFWYFFVLFLVLFASRIKALFVLKLL